LSIVLSLLGALFRFQDLLARLFGLEDSTPTARPLVSPQDAAGAAPFGWRQDRHGRYLFYRYWLPEGQPRASLVCVHGVGAHGRHLRVIGEHLAPAGFAVYAFDLAGHGLSEGKRGDLTDLEGVVDGLADMVDFAAETWPGAPVFVLGESFGGLLALKIAARHPAELRGIIVSGAELEPTAESAGGVANAIRQYSPLVLFVLFRSRARVIDIAGREELVSRLPGVAHQSRTDPMRNNKISPRTVVSIYRLVSQAMDVAREVRVPALILQGGGDLVTNPAAAWTLQEALGMATAEVVVFPGAYHGLFYDPDTPKVLETIEVWLGQHLAEPAAGA
jgi:acylglycerol lipase